MFTCSSSRKPLTHNNKAKERAQRKKLVAALTDESPIYFSRYENPIIASDLRIYDLGEYRELIQKHHVISPFTREPLSDLPYPYHYRAYKGFVQAPNMINISRLCQCSVSQQRMKNPMIASLLYTTQARELFEFVTVCDASMLNQLPQQLKVLKKREWPELKALSEHCAERVDKNLPSTNNIQPARAWLKALKVIRASFPPSTESAAINQQPIVPTPNRFFELKTEVKHRPLMRQTNLLPLAQRDVFQAAISDAAAVVASMNHASKEEELSRNYLRRCC